jgi:hypothetical protein
MAVPTKTLEYVEEWLDDELRNYVYEKFDLKQDAEHIHQFTNSEIGEDTWWDIQLHQYLDRAKLIGLDNVNGRQALGKYVATAIGMLVAAVDKYGELPHAGVPSGQNLDNLRPL